MKDWYHSGIEGYCKAASQMMGLPNDNSGWGNFGRDLFSDGRFDDPVKASKTWTLSRFRGQGRSNRPKLFEQSWLGEDGIDCELEAVHTCVHAMCNKESTSAIFELYLHASDTFAADFHKMVLPAIEDGFSTERFRASDIARFSQGIDKNLKELDPTLPQTFRHFAIPLVAGLIYGPDHPVARSSSNSATLRRPHDDVVEDASYGIDMGSIVLTQVFRSDAAFVGYSDSFNDGNSILLGRGSDPKAYLDACGPEFANATKGKKPIVFPIAHTHKSVSNEHGIITRIGETWYYHDFSTNGTCILNDGQATPVHRKIVALAPGDRIVLGLTDPSEDEVETYCLGTAVLVSFKAGEAAFEPSDLP